METTEHPNYLEPVDLHIACMRCSGQPAFHETVEAFLVSGLIIAFHSAHEGHPLKIVANGKEYRPGVR